VSHWFNVPKPLIIAHRGASSAAPENSFEAFMLAADQKADGIELDIQLTANGVPVVMHDWTVDRTTGGSGLVSNLTLIQIQSLDAGDGRPVPTLDQVFELFGPTLLYNIELKEQGWRDRGLAAAVSDRIEGHQLEDNVLVSSFNPFTLRRCRRFLPQRIPLALVRSPGLQRYSYWLVDGQADHPEACLVDNAYMTWANKRGYRVHTWTVDEVTEARRLVALGVHGIITNEPAAIRAGLA
jgi:glycerophosphoryl diester phosphodiesterase